MSYFFKIALQKTIEISRIVSLIESKYRGLGPKVKTFASKLGLSDASSPHVIPG